MQDGRKLQFYCSQFPVKEKAPFIKIVNKIFNEEWISMKYHPVEM